MEEISKKITITWSKSKRTSDGCSESYNVEEAENGFIISYSKSYKEDGEWKYEDKKYLSKKNPLEDMASKEEESILDKLPDSLGSQMTINF